MTLDQLGDWDGQGIVVRRDPDSDAWILIGIHDTTLGPAVGGTRMRVYPRLDDAIVDVQRLAAGMTRKMAIAGLPYGGGKAVVAVPKVPSGSARRGLLLRYGELVDSLRGTFLTAPDVGTTTEDMDVIGRRTEHVLGRSTGAGGSGSSGRTTAIGVRHAIRAALQALDGSPEIPGRTIAIQGLGSVGGELAAMLAADGAALLVADVDPERARSVAAQIGAAVVDTADVLAARCDVLSPCATGGILTAGSIERLRCRIVAGGANNQLAQLTDAERLAARGILYAPDYVVNAGGAIGAIGGERLGWDAPSVEAHLEGIGRTLEGIFESAQRLGITTTEAAERLAKAVLREQRQSRAA